MQCSSISGSPAKRVRHDLHVRADSWKHGTQDGAFQHAERMVRYDDDGTRLRNTRQILAIDVVGDLELL